MQAKEYIPQYSLSASEEAIENSKIKTVVCCAFILNLSVFLSLFCNNSVHDQFLREYHCDALHYSFSLICDFLSFRNLYIEL
jgi:hypothetical protein